MRLIKSHFLAGGVGVAASGWTPEELGTTLKGWYNPDAQSQADGATVTSLLDQSGNSNNFNQVGVEPCPLLIYNFVNGRKALEWGGPDIGGSSIRRHLRCTNTLLDSATAGTMIIVMKAFVDPAGGSANEGVIQNFTSSGSTCHVPFSDGQAYENFGSSIRRTIAVTPLLSSWRIYGVHSATNDWTLWLDGTAISTSGTNTVGFSTIDRDLGTRTAGGGWFRGHTAEKIFCNSKLSTGDRQKVEGYLAHKYALTANLPSDHPYKSTAP